MTPSLGQQLGMLFQGSKCSRCLGLARVCEHCESTGIDVTRATTQLAAVLLHHPELLQLSKALLHPEIVAVLPGVKIAGGWVDAWCRYSFIGIVAEVWGPSVGEYYARALLHTAPYGFSSPSEARVWCDAQLRKEGWVFP